MNNEHEVGNLSKNGLIFNALDLSHFNLENFAALRENGPVQTPPQNVEFSTLFFDGFPYLLPIINIIVWFWREHLIVLQCKMSFSTGTFHFIMTTLLQ